MVAASEFNLDAIGRRVEGSPYRVTREEIVAYAAATDDDTPAFREGRLAPPVYALNPVLATMVEARKMIAPQFAFHGEHDIWFHRPIEPGMTLTPAAEVIGVHQRSSGVTVTTRVTSRADSELVNEQYFISFVAGGLVEKSCGSVAPPHELEPGETEAEPFATYRFHMAPDQTRRYAEASHDYDAYTTDERVAREMGFPTLLVHGMCTFAFSSRAAVAALCPNRPECLVRLAVRLSKPVFLVPGQRIETRVWQRPSGPDDARRSVSFIACDSGGEVVLTNGLAEVKPC